MKGFTRVLIISSFSTLLLLFSFLYLKFFVLKEDSDTVSSQSTSISSVPLTKNDAKDIFEIDIKNELFNFKIKAKSEDEDTDFEIEELEKNGGKVSKDLVKRLFKNFSNFSAIKIVSENSDDLQQYGLDNLEKVRVSTIVKYRDSKEKVFCLGKETVFGDGFFLKIDSDPKVYVISKVDSAMLLSRPESYAEKPKVEKPSSENSSEKGDFKNDDVENIQNSEEN
ncbi:MAG: DUF4340 domain-containing protein [Oscillospiraceae bacterium]|nr:DUF4340 domain-containing protein [Oscillospiraceae bacterium]